jgi:hypothetical protein
MNGKEPAHQPHHMTPEEIARYRAGVNALVATCLEQIRAYPIGNDADPQRERPLP